MRIVGATFVNNEVEPGWQILRDDVPLGKRYLVDLDRVESMVMDNLETGQSVPLDVIWSLDRPGEPGGWLPLIALKLEADA